MTIKTMLRYTTPLILAGLIATPAAAGPIFSNVDEIRARTPAGAGFDQQLAQEYKTLAIYEADEMYDWIDAENHAVKGNMAAEGNVPMPYVPAEWDIEDPAKLQELELARAELISALDAGGRTTAPEEAAIAQAKYDCWVEQQEEGHQLDHIAACREQFLAAMENLKAAMTPVAAVSEEIAREVVYFDFDQSTITTAAQTKIDRFVRQMKEIRPVVTLYIEGHADKSGPSDYNVALSARRANAVQVELERQGMNVGDYSQLDLEAEGEDDPAVQTADGVREPLNRRVEIIARGQKTEYVDPAGKTASLWVR